MTTTFLFNDKSIFILLIPISIGMLVWSFAGKSNRVARFAIVTLTVATSILLFLFTTGILEIKMITTFLFKSNNIIIPIIPIVIGILVWVLGDKINKIAKIVLGLIMLATSIFLYLFILGVKEDYTIVPVMPLGQTTLEKAESLLDDAGIFYDRANYDYTSEAWDALCTSNDFSNPNLVVIGVDPECDSLIIRGTEVVIRVGFRDIFSVSSISTINQASDEDIAPKTLLSEIERNGAEEVNSNTIDFYICNTGARIISSIPKYNVAVGSLDVESATVRFVNSRTKEYYQGITDAFGHVIFTNLHNGSYYYIISSDGYLTKYSDHLYEVKPEQGKAAFLINTNIEKVDSLFTGDFRVRFLQTDGTVVANKNILARSDYRPEYRTERTDYLLINIPLRTNDDGFLTGWTIINGKEQYVIVTFNLNYENILDFYSEDGEYIDSISIPIDSSEIRLLYDP